MTPHTEHFDTKKTAATPTLPAHPTLMNTHDGSPDFLLQQLQQRLLALAETSTAPTHNSAEKSALMTLISLLYHAQNQGMGALATPTLSPLINETADSNMTVDDLGQCFPHLISQADAMRPTPIIRFGEFVAFRRDWQQLADTAAYLQRGGSMRFPSAASLQRIQWKLGNGASVSDEQKRAAISAAALPFCVITGGAGTGKTTTLAKGLELILLDNPNATILLAAPTGKAAHRLNESLTAQLSSVHESVRPALQNISATTIHRLLGISEHSGKPFHHRKNPLRCDVLAIDEASMIGGDIFALIQQAVLPHTHVVLLGDANQLPAINSTAFFNDISRLNVGYDADFCHAVNPYLSAPITPQPSPLPNAICQLSVSRRFAEQSQIELVADAILNREPEVLFQHLGSDSYDVSTWGKDFVKSLAHDYPQEPSALLNTLSQRIILCAHRQGTFGSVAVNRYLDQQFRQRLGSSGQRADTWYNGRRIMIEQNDYQLGINNGDIGQCQWQENSWVIVFDDGRQLPVRELLDEKYSLAFAISIHKSQGSEYPHVDVVLDSFNPEAPNPLVNQALLYTAVTRAKKTLRLYADKPLVAHALLTHSATKSPLQALLSS